MEQKTPNFARSFRPTEAEVRLLRLELLQEMLEVVNVTLDLYRKNPSQKLEDYVRLFKKNYDEFKKELGV